MAEIYCHYEPGSFPAAEFYQDNNGRLIHQRAPLHYVIGERVIPTVDPGVPAHVKILIDQACKNPSVMSHDDIQKLLDHIQ